MADDDFEEEIEPHDEGADFGEAVEAQHFAESDTDASERVPTRIALFFTGVEDGQLEDVVDGVVEDAVNRGLFFEWGASSEMEDNEVIAGSPLHQALTGEMPRN